MPNLAALSPSPKLQFFDSNGLPLAGGKLFTYAAGTSIQQATFTDSTEAANNTNPIILDSTGSASVWLGASFYRMVLQDSNSVQLWDIDNISSSNLPFITSFLFLEGAAPPGVVGSDILYALATSHRLAMNNNNAGQDLIVGQNTFDILANKTLTSPVLHVPTLDSPLFTGTPPNLNVNSLNTIVFPDAIPGATADVKFNTAITALRIGGGGIIDARGMQGTQVIASQVDIGDVAGTPIVFIVPANVIYAYRIANPTASVFKLHSNSAFICLEGSPYNQARIQPLVGSANVASVVSMDESGPFVFGGIDMYQSNLGGAQVQRAVWEITTVNTKSLFMNVGIQTFNGIGLWIHNTTGTSMGDFGFQNLVINGGDTIGSLPLKIETTGAGGIENIKFTTGAMERQDPSGPIAIINGHGTQTIIQLTFDEVQFETVATSGPMVSLTDAGQVAFMHPSCRFIAGGAGNFITAAESVPGLTRRIELFHAYVTTGNVLDTSAIDGVPVVTALDFSGTWMSPTYNAGGNKEYVRHGGLSLTSDKNIQLAKLINNYNGIATVGNGIPSEYATVDLTGQTAAIVATTLYTPITSGMFRIPIYLKVTTPATTGAATSTLGSLAITYTDATDSVAQVLVPALNLETGTVATANTGNTTAAKLVGTAFINAKAGVPIQFAVNYASNTAAQMAYEVHLKCEAL
jgi:hypothetical protein